MKVAILATIAALAVAHAAPSPSEPGSSIYNANSDETCTIAENGSVNCVPGHQNNAPDFDNYVDDVVAGGNDKRDLTKRGWTCGWGGNWACRRKCRDIHKRECGGECRDGGDGWGDICYCRARC